MEHRARQVEPEGWQVETGEWRIETLAGRAEDLHRRDVAGHRLALVHAVSVPALVLGSRQRGHELPGQLPSGAELATRHSGGGAVWLSPGEQVWIDLVIPADDPLHRDDIRAAAILVGDAWVKTLGGGAAHTWHGSMSERELSSFACFAGVGPGEVLLGERKLVGISQRRTSKWSRFQCVAYLSWDPEPLLAALVGPSAGTADGGIAHRLSAVLHSGVATLPDALATGVDPGDIGLSLARSLVASLG